MRTQKVKTKTAYPEWLGRNNASSESFVSVNLSSLSDQASLIQEEDNWLV